MRLSRFQLSTLVGLAVALVGLVVVVDTRPASAGITDDPDHWAYESADWVQNECHDIPTSMLGAASGVVAPLGFTQNGGQALVSAGSPPTTIPTPATAIRENWRDPWYRQHLTNAEMQAWLENKPSQRPSIPIHTVGGSNSQVIETTGTVRVGTDNSKSVVTPARVAGTSVSALAGSTVALSALVFTGTLCGTINGLGAVFGDPWAEKEYPVDYSELEVLAGPRECRGLTGIPGAYSDSTYSDQCIQVVMPTGTSLAMMKMTTDGTNVLNAPDQLRRNSGSLNVWRESAPGPQWVVFPCATPGASCGLPPFVDEWPPAGQWSNHFLAATDNFGNVLGVVPLFPDARSKGQIRRLRSYVECQGVTMPSTTIENFSATFFDADPTPNWPPASCPVGTAPVKVLLQRQTLTGGSTLPAAWGSPVSTSLDWEQSTAVKGNPQTLACFAVGAPPCPIVDAPGDPTRVAVGGTGGLTAPKTEPTADDAVGSLIDGMDFTDLPDEYLRPDPTTDPTAPPGGGGGGDTGPPGDQSVPESDPPGPPTPPGSEDNQWAACMDSQLGEDWGTVTWNPITWVRAIVYYVTAPIVCALWWLVVPPGGFGALLDVFMEPLEDSELVSSIELLIDDWEWNGGCAPVDFGDPLAGMGPSLGEIDVGMCGNIVIALVWAVILGLAVLSMGGRLVRTLWTFGQYEQAGYV